MRYGGDCYHCNYDTNSNSLNFSDYPPQPQYETNICELCGNDAHFGFDCSLQVLFNSYPDPCFDQNFDNNFPLNSPSFPQQYLCCENCGGPHATFQCQPMNQSYDPNFSGFDQYQPQFSITYQLPRDPNKDMLLEMEKLIRNNRIFFNNNIFLHEEMSIRALLAKERILKLFQAWDEKQIETWRLPELLPQLLNDSKTIEEERIKRKQAANLEIQKEESFKKKDISIEEIMSEKRMIDDEINDITNDLSYKRFRGEKIDDEYERDCEIKIKQLLQDYSGLDIEMWKKERVLMEEKSLTVSQRIKSICNDDEDDSIHLRDIIALYSSSKAITPDLPDNSLSMGDEHLSTSVENLVLIPSEFEGISNVTYDVPVGEDSSTFDALNDHSEILSDSNDDDTSSDDDDFVDIEYVSLEEVNDVKQEEEEINLEDILQIQDVILCEKLLNINRLITNIESLNDNPTFDRVLKSSFPFPIPVVDSDSFFEESDTSLSHLDNSLPEFETSNDHTEDTRSDSTTTHANNSLPEYESFLFEIDPDQEELISSVISNNSTNVPLLEAVNTNDSLSLPNFESFHFDPSFPRPPPEPLDVEISLNFEPDAPVINIFDELNEDECFDPRGGEIDFSQNVEDDDSFTFVIWTFLPFLTYPADSSLLFSTRSEDTIFDPGIST
ncbi:hypothetical protein Tco_0365868 [Tanacetum coccineum]